MITLLLVVNLCLTIALLTQLGNTHHHVIEHLDRRYHSLTDRITMSTQEAVNALTAQLRKAAGEIQAKIADLNVQIIDAGVADKVDLTELTTAAQVLDDIVPDNAEVADELPAEVAGDNPPF